MTDRDSRDTAKIAEPISGHFPGENGQVEGADRVEDTPNALQELQRTREERDAYQQAAVTAESNELTLHRQLSGYMSAELEQLRGEVAVWRKRADERERDERERDERLNEESAKEAPYESEVIENRP